MTLVLLGSVGEINIVDPIDDAYVEDANATDMMEECALNAPAPGPSLRRVGSE